MRTPFSHRATAGVLVSLVAVACVATNSSPGSGPVGARSSTSLSSVIFVIDTAVGGSEYILSAFNDPLLTFNGSKGSDIVAAFTNDTTFRNAQTDKFAPTDPCQGYAIAYNTAGAAVDATALFSAIASMASNGCHARILTEKSLPIPPPIRSFRPLP
jgi:hypothetical protein